MHLDHVSEIDTSLKLLLNMLLSGSKLSVFSGLQMKLDEFIFKPLKNLIFLEGVGGQRSLF